MVTGALIDVTSAPSSNGSRFNCASMNFLVTDSNVVAASSPNFPEYVLVTTITTGTRSDCVRNDGSLDGNGGVVGLRVGTATDVRSVGDADGLGDGTIVVGAGETVGSRVAAVGSAGEVVGCAVGSGDGGPLGARLGLRDGACVVGTKLIGASVVCAIIGEAEGMALATTTGAAVGRRVGLSVAGLTVGASTGAGVVGLTVGANTGAGVVGKTVGAATAAGQAC